MLSPYFIQQTHRDLLIPEWSHITSESMIDKPKTNVSEAVRENDYRGDPLRVVVEETIDERLRRIYFLELLVEEEVKGEVPIHHSKEVQHPRCLRLKQRLLPREDR